MKTSADSSAAAVPANGYEQSNGTKKSLLWRFLPSVGTAVLETVEALAVFLLSVCSPLSHLFDSSPEPDSHLVGPKGNFLICSLFVPLRSSAALAGGVALRGGLSESIPAEST